MKKRLTLVDLYCTILVQKSKQSSEKAKNRIGRFYALLFGSIRSKGNNQLFCSFCFTRTTLLRVKNYSQI